MKNILIISDTHGNIKGVSEVLNNNKIDYIIHLGDNYADVDNIKSIANDIPIWYVFGNHDLEWLEPKEILFEINGIKMYATHGHRLDIKLGYDELISIGKNNGAKVVLCGHSHIQKCIYKDGIIVINPGSFSESRDKNISGSYCILQIEKSDINVICRWNEYEEILGVEINTVKLEEYNPKYKELFIQEKNNLMNLLKDKIIQIEHVGSTSMPGIVSKPIIDIVVAIKDLSEIKEIENILVKEGYIYRGPIESENDRYQFLKGNSIKRDFHIYFTTLNSEVWYDYVLYRDYMLSHEQDLRKYESLKKSLAKLYPNDRRNYLKHKQNFINEIHVKARKLYLKDT